MREHTEHACMYPDCAVCAGGLFKCDICGGAEGALTTECPGALLSGEQMEDVYRGKLDLVNDAWQQTSSPHSPMGHAERRLALMDKEQKKET